MPDAKVRYDGGHIVPLVIDLFHLLWYNKNEVEHMNEIIYNIFGEFIKEEGFQFPAGTPNYIKYGYHVSRLIWGEKDCLLVMPKSDAWNLPSLKKQLREIEKLCQMPLIADLKRITALQRTNLIGSGIAFVSGTGQLFVPFWGSYFEEKIKNPPLIKDKMTANAQLIFLYLYYRNRMEHEHINLTQISRKLDIPKSTCSHAIQLLEGLDLISLANEGTVKWISISGSADKALEKAIPHMISPVQRQVYVKKVPYDLLFKVSGIKALSAGTMLGERKSDGGYAIDRNQAKNIPKETVIDRQQFDDFGGQIIEIWKYDPALLSESEYVDDLSLLISLYDDPDERVQNELDNLRNRYGVEGGKL